MPIPFSRKYESLFDDTLKRRVLFSLLIHQVHEINVWN
jgi:hypothetical protein